MLALACFTFTGSLQAQTAAAPPASAPTTAPSAADAAEAKRRFTVGLKLYGEHAYLEALAEFESSYRLGGRPSALRNVAQCHRDLRHFAYAYDAYARLLSMHGSQLSTADRDAVTHALDELSELSAAITIKTGEAGASVELDGKPLGTAPLGDARRVSLGAHHIVVTKSGFEPFDKTVTVQSNESLVVDAALAPEVTTGHLTVREQHGTAVHVLIDDKDLGPAPWEGDLPPGDHMLEARGPTFAADRRPFTLGKKQRLDMILDATTTQGHLRLTTSPGSASITVDGQNVGTGVWDADVNVGPHHIEVTLKDATPVVRDISVQRGQLVALDIPVLAATGFVPDYRGVYTTINAFGVASPSHTAMLDTPVSTDFHFGLGGALHIGYAFGRLSVELAAAFMVDHYDEAQSGGSVNGTPLHQTGIDTFVGLGGRITSPGATVRGTFGVAPGVAIHVVNVNVDSSGSSCASLNPCGGTSNSFSAGFAAPGLMFDGGLLVGSTPGAKFYLGVDGWLDFAPTLRVGPDESGTFAASAHFPGLALKAVGGGPEFYIGPALGVRFGH